MEVHDRGTMKWVSLMLPEHVEELRKVFSVKKEKPILDEQQMDEIDHTLKQSIQQQKMLQLTYYDAGHFRTVRGTLAKIDQRHGYIILCDGVGKSIPLRDVIDAEIVYRTERNEIIGS